MDKVWKWQPLGASQERERGRGRVTERLGEGVGDGLGAQPGACTEEARSVGTRTWGSESSSPIKTHVSETPHREVRDGPQEGLGLGSVCP